MKTIIQLSIVLLITGITFSCNEHSEKDHNNTEEIEAEDHHEHGEGLRLDHGSRWIANLETTQGVNNMITLMDEFSEKENTDAYALLTEKLKAEFTMIFEKCTMEGESHHQLHNFLVPVKELLKGLQSSDLNVCKNSYSKLDSHLDEYQKYFE